MAHNADGIPREISSVLAILCFQSRLILRLRVHRRLRISPGAWCVNNWFIIRFTMTLQRLSFDRSSYVRSGSPTTAVIRFIADIAITTSLCNCADVLSNRYRRAASCKRARKAWTRVHGIPRVLRYLIRAVSLSLSLFLRAFRLRVYHFALAFVRVTPISKILCEF